MATARQALRQRREHFGWSQIEAACKLKVSPTTLRSWEAGGPVRPRHRRQIARVYQLSLTEVSVMLGDPEAPNGEVVLRWLGDLGRLEAAAGEIQAFEPIVIHGLLQTADYATAVERVGSFNDGYVAEKVRVRMLRQAVLRRKPPLQLSVVLDESVLYRVAGDHEIMAEQLGHLIDVADYPDVTLQIMPFASAVFPAGFGAFWLFTHLGEPDPHMVYMEDAGGPDPSSRPPDIDAHVELFDHLSTTALSPEESVEFIHATAKERYQ